MRIYLTGFMGAGKSKVGRALALRLNLPFVDLDDAIEASEGMSIREIFAARGEDAFRDLEHRRLIATEDLERVVVATGGGLFTLARNQDVIRRLGVSAWLHPSFVTIAARIRPKGTATRPLFRDEAQAEELYRRRLPEYEKADLRVDIGPEETAEQVAARIADTLRSTLTHR